MFPLQLTILMWTSIPHTPGFSLKMQFAYTKKCLQGTILASIFIYYSILHKNRSTWLLPHVPYSYLLQTVSLSDALSHYSPQCKMQVPLPVLRYILSRISLRGRFFTVYALESFFIQVQKFFPHR